MVQTYLFTDLPSLSAKFFAGKYYTVSNVFDSVRFSGVSVFTDENMLPASLRGMHRVSQEPRQVMRQSLSHKMDVS